MGCSCIPNYLSLDFFIIYFFHNYFEYPVHPPPTHIPM